MDNLLIQTSVELYDYNKEKLHLFTENNKSNSLDARYIGSINTVDKKHKEAMADYVPFSILLVGIPFLIFEISRHRFCTTKIEINGRKFRVKKSEYRQFLKKFDITPKKGEKLYNINLNEIIKEKVTKNPEKFEEARPSEIVLKETKRDKTQLLQHGIYNNNLSEIKSAILGGADINKIVNKHEYVQNWHIKSSRSGTPLGFAVYTRNSDLAKWLVAYGADTKVPFTTVKNKHTTKEKGYGIDRKLKMKMLSEKKTTDSPKKQRKYDVMGDELSIPSS